MAREGDRLSQGVRINAFRGLGPSISSLKKDAPNTCFFTSFLQTQHLIAGGADLTKRGTTMQYDKKSSASSLELVVLGLLAALVCSLAFPLFSHINQQDPPAISVEAMTAPSPHSPSAP
ncbi:MAG: hypothetical protein RL417_639 [Pseudomonadota bacterium]|jgi:hypothetical protein